MHLWRWITWIHITTALGVNITNVHWIRFVVLVWMGLKRLMIHPLPPSLSLSLSSLLFIYLFSLVMFSRATHHSGMTASHQVFVAACWLSWHFEEEWSWRSRAWGEKAFFLGRWAQWSSVEFCKKGQMWAVWHSWCFSLRFKDKCTYVGFIWGGFPPLSQSCSLRI